MQERRNYPRLDISVGVSWKKVGASGQAIESDLTKNIAAGGICLIMLEKVVIGDVLFLELSLPTKETIVCRGRVVWARELGILGKEAEKKFDVGVEFVDISPDDRETIKKFVFSFLR
jgi:c-di-GMP-binding flagellar brake protein YcgR